VVLRLKNCRLPKCRKVLTMSTTYDPILTAPKGLGAPPAGVR
jgi:hypothetical protein